MGTRPSAPVVLEERALRRWSRRPPVLILLVPLLLLGGIAGTIVPRAQWTLSEIRSLSEPAAAVSGAALGGDAGVRIDTSAAGEWAGAGVDGDDGWWGWVRAAAGEAASGTEALAATTKELAVGGAVASGLTDAPAGTMTVLVMGVDARPGEPIDVGVRPDALMVLHLDPAADACRVLAVPRDTRAELPGYGLSKANHALAVGGIPYQRRVIEGFLGIALDNHVLVDFAGFEAMVDAVGGITVDVTTAFTFDGMAFEVGPRRLTGAEALLYARYRGGADGDFGRIGRQQQIVRALLRAVGDRGIGRDVTDLLTALERHVRTDLTPVEILILVEEYRDRCTDDRVEMATMAGTSETHDDPMLRRPLEYVVVAPEEVRRKVDWLVGA